MMARSPVSDYYLHDTDSLWSFVDSHVSVGRRLLNVGCAAGQDAPRLRSLGVETLCGIEPTADAAARARCGYDVVDECSFEEWESTATFDTVVFADSLEHMADPQRTLGRAHQLLAPSGILVLSVPNVRHLSVLLSLALRGEWRYQPSGILDRTHLRFFTRRSIVRLVGDCGFDLVAWRRWGAQPLTQRLEDLVPGSGEFFQSQVFLVCRKPVLV